MPTNFPNRRRPPSLGRQRAETLRSRLPGVAFADEASRKEPDSGLAKVLGQARPRRLVDLLAAGPGSGAGLIGLAACRRACLRRGELVVVDPSSTFFPPAAAAWGIDTRRLLVVTPASERDALAVVETALRSPAVGAVWARLAAIDPLAFRRLLLAAEAGEAFGVLVRPARHEPDPSWADVQYRVEPAPATDPTPRAELTVEPEAASDHVRGLFAERPHTVRVTPTRHRHGPVGGSVTVSIDWRTGQIEEVLAPQDRGVA